MKKLSIITINYNNMNGLERTIQSVCSQHSNAFEYIVIDGNSSDGSKNILSQNKTVIDHCISEPDKGVYDAMNKGMFASNGEYLLFLNSGDVLLDKYVLSRVLPELSSDLLACNIIDGDWVFRSPPKITSDYFLNSSLPHPGTFIKRSLAKALNGYNQHLKIVGDWDFFVRALFFEKCSYSAKEIFVASIEKSGLSFGGLQNQVLRKEHQQLLDKYFPGNSNGTPNKLSFLRKIKKSLFN